MRKSPILTISLLVLLALAFMSSWMLSRPIFDQQLNQQQMRSALRVAPIEQAITFAQVLSGEVILVLDVDKSGITGINLSAQTDQQFTDAIDAYLQMGSGQLRSLAQTGKNQRQHFPWQQLAIPLNEHYPHIAAGTNFQSHAAEVGHDGEPFLFPKLSHATAWNADVYNDGRLDYEVELCAIPLSNHSPESPAQLAYLLCGDFTDRWLLVKEIDTGEPMGPTGFPAGKGGDSRLPVGFLLLIPDADDFYKNIQLSLYVNQDLRQQASAKAMIWDSRKILAEILLQCQTPYYRGAQQLTMLSSCDTIPNRTLILTGTPEGVIFNIATLWNPFAYLRPGDVVTSTATYLGFTRNRIY